MSFDAFFAAMDEVGQALLRVLKPGGYMAMILRDAYQNGEYIPTSAILALRYRELGWAFKGEKIWYATGSRIVPMVIHRALCPILSTRIF